jgi:hypothetical protein
MSIEAMKLALEALEYHQDQTRPIHKTQETIAALRKAIEQAEQAEQWDTSDMAHRFSGLAIDDDDIQEYKKPWVGLTDEEIYEIRKKTFDSVATNYEAYRAIEAKLKERNNG